MESAEEEATVLSPRLSFPLSSGSIMAPWGPQTPVRWHQQTQAAAAETNSLFCIWVPSVGLVHAITPCCGQGNITSSSAPFKKRTFYGRSQLLVSQVQARMKRSTSNEEASKAKAMWRAGEVTKPRRQSKTSLRNWLLAKQQIELKANHINEKGSRIGDGKPLSRSSQWQRHELGGYSDR